MLEPDGRQLSSVRPHSNLTSPSHTHDRQTPLSQFAHKPKLICSTCFNLASLFATQRFPLAGVPEGVVVVGWVPTLGGLLELSLIERNRQPGPCCLAVLSDRILTGRQLHHR